MAELRRKIEERASKSGLEEELDVGDREVLLRPESPEVEGGMKTFSSTELITTSTSSTH